MTRYAPLHQQNLGYSATLDRQLIDVVFASPGTIAGTDLAVTQRGAGANMSVDVAAGRCVVTGTDATGQGKYLCWSDAVTNVTIATAPGTGLSRIDLIVAQVRDGNQNAGPNNDWIITAIAGTASSSPSAPSAPPSSFVLAHVAVGANVTSIVTANITDNRVGAGLPPWIAPTYLNGYTTGTVPVAYRLIGNRVTLRGNAVGVTAFTVMFTLPAGYRPQTAMTVSVATSSGALPVTIDTAGNVSCINAFATAYLDGVTFLID